MLIGINMAYVFSSAPVVLTLLLTIIITLVYCYFKHSFSYFQRQNIPSLTPSFPLGNISKSFFQKYGQEVKILYEAFKKKGEKYGGFYLVTKPVILPVNPEIIKQILAKDFQYFYDRGIYHNEEKEFITAHLFAISGPEWKTLRAKFTPTFSPSKLKNMVTIMLEKTKKLEDKLQDLSSTSTSFEAKDLCVRITTDMFCSVGFGIDCNSLVDNNADFPKFAKKLLTNNLYHTIKFCLAIAVPRIFKKLNLNFVKSEFTDFFVNVITEVVESREKHSIDRPDFMNLLIKLKNNINIDDDKTNEKGDAKITMKQLIAQCYIFFVAGFDTSSTTMNYCLFELTQNQNLQNKLREEIRSVYKKHDGKLSYEAIMKMQLLDKVIAETLRKYPPVAVLNRLCMEDYIIPGTNSVIENGTSVMISVLGLHHDPEYYPNPDKFDPERFSEAEKAKRHPYVYLPFGDGPKNCIGMRLGLLQTKMGLIYLLKNYEYTLNSTTKLPLQFKFEAFLQYTDGDIWINVNKIS